MILFHQIVLHVDDDIMSHYMTLTSVKALIMGLSKRFDPQTTTTEVNDVHLLFQLRRPIWELDKLLDDAEQYHSRIIAKGISFPDQVFYYAIVGIIPPAYYHMRTAYETSKKARAAEGTKVDFVSSELILELRKSTLCWVKIFCSLFELFFPVGCFLAIDPGLLVARSLLFRRSLRTWASHKIRIAISSAY